MKFENVLRNVIKRVTIHVKKRSMYFLEQPYATNAQLHKTNYIHIRTKIGKRYNPSFKPHSRDKTFTAG